MKTHVVLASLAAAFTISIPALAAPPEEGAAPSDVRTAKNSIFVEGLGNGGLYSLNYERLIGDFGVRAGFSYMAVSAGDANATLITVPILANYYLGGANHKLQLGLGADIVYLSASTAGSTFGTGYLSGSGAGVAGTGVIGYRYVPHDGGFDFGVGFTPLFGGGGFLPWGGIHFGAVI